MPGRAISNWGQRSASGRRSASAMGAKVRTMARSPRSGRLMTSSMPFSRIGRAASNRTSSSSNGEAAAGGEAAKGVGEPVGEVGEVIEGEEMTVIGGNHQFALFT